MIDMFFISYRSVKDALWSSGENITPKHIEEVSLSALFLAEPAKKVDQEFGVSSKRTEHDCNSDISTHLLNNLVTAEIPE